MKNFEYSQHLNGLQIKGIFLGLRNMFCCDIIPIMNFVFVVVLLEIKCKYLRHLNAVCFVYVCDLRLLLALQICNYYPLITIYH